MSGRLESKVECIGMLAGAELDAEWHKVFAEPPPDISPSLLRRALAQERQERALGGLPRVMRRQLETMAAGGGSAKVEMPIKLKPGTRLMREWNGTMYSVLVGPDGFEFAGRTWKSLSGIALHITGAHWSGPRFFGLKTRRR